MALGLIAAAQFVGILLVTGAVVYRGALVSRCGLDRAALHATAARTGTLGAVGAVLVLWSVPARAVIQAQGMTFPGEPWLPFVRVVLQDTPLGELLVLQGAAALLAGIAMLVARGDSTLAWSAAGLGAIVLTLLPGLMGHAVSSARPALSVAAASLHVAAAGIWLGTVVYLWRDARSSFAGRAIRAFHPWALAAATAVSLSGAVQVWVLVPSWSALVASRWGAMLAVKLLVLGAILGVGQHHWRRAAALIDAGRHSALRRTLGVEVALALLIMLVTAALTTTPPPE